MQTIIRTYYVLAGLYTFAASLIWAVNTLFLLDAGLSIGEVFLANAVFSVGMVLFEIPTGVVADTLGRRASYLLSIVVLAVTTLLYLAAASAEAGVVTFSVISLFMGLGFTFYSGSLEAWLVDALHSVGFIGELDRVFARSQQVTGVAMLLGTVAGGVLAQFDLAVPFVVRAALLAGLLAIAWRTMHDLGFEPRPLKLSLIGTELAQQTRVGVSHGWNEPGLRLLMMSGMARATFFGWAFYASQPYFLELLRSDQVWVVGVITALISLSTIAGNQLVEILTRTCDHRSTLILGASIMSSIAAIVVGLANSFWVAVPAFLLVTGAMGVISPVRQAYLHSVTASEHRATVISFDSMISSVGGAGGQVGLGRISDIHGFSAGYVVGGAFTTLAWPFLWGVRLLGGPADAIAGTSGTAGTCTVQGLPSETQVSAHHTESAVN